MKKITRCEKFDMYANTYSLRKNSLIHAKNTLGCPTEDHGYYHLDYSWNYLIGDKAASVRTVIALDEGENEEESDYAIAAVDQRTSLIFMHYLNMKGF